MDDFHGDAFDHTDAGFCRWRQYQRQRQRRPADRLSPHPAGHAALGGAMEKSHGRELQQHAWLRLLKVRAMPCGAIISTSIPPIPTAYGRPLLRMTFDFPDNDLRMCGVHRRSARQDRRHDGSQQVSVSRCNKGWDSVPYQTTHNTGGAIMGADPSRSAINRYLQSWDVSNVFVMGASAFQQNAGMQSHRHGWRADLLGGGSDQGPLRQQSRPAGAGMKAWALILIMGFAASPSIAADAQIIAAPDNAHLQAGAAIYQDNWTARHGRDGSGEKSISPAPRQRPCAGDERRKPDPGGAGRCAVRPDGQDPHRSGHALFRVAGLRCRRPPTP